MTGETIAISAADGETEAYVARPSGIGPYPAVIIAPTVRGPTALEEERADALANEAIMQARAVAGL